MKKPYPLICLVAMIACQDSPQKAEPMNVDAAKPPVAKMIPKDVGMHGDKRIDNYYWLNEPKNPEVISYLNAENAYTEAVMKPTVALQDKLFAEMKGRIKEDDASVPYKDGNYYYYSRYEKGGEYPIYCRKQGSLEGKEEVLLHGNEMGKGKKYFSIGGYEISDNEELIAYGTDTVSRRNYTLQFKNLKTGEILKDKIKNTEGGAYAWAADNKTVFYMIRDQQTLLASKVYRHEIGTDSKKDVLVYEEKDHQFYTGVYRMKSKKYVAIHTSQNGVADEVRLLDAQKPQGQFEVFLPRRKGHEYGVDHLENKFLIRTNKDAAENFKLMEVAEGQQGDESAWKELIAHRKDVYLDGFDVFKSHLVVQERREGLIQLRIINQQNKQEHYLEFGEPAYAAGIGNNPDFNTNIVRYGYTSLTTPNSTFDYNMDTKDKKLMKEQEVPGGYDKTEYVTERLWAPARDGRKIPISIVYKKGTEKNGKAPLLQYAYGSYGASMDTYFSTNRLSLLNRGFVYALCHIRGGQEMGRYWYEEGKMFKKKNTFTDFTDCSEFLVKEQFTSTEGLFAMGGSAGGLLMGAVANLAPQLYKGMVAQVPFVDVVTTMLDESIPLTTGEFEEWGNPKNKASYDYMKSYSPYDNVEKKAYPNMLITTGLHDSQVQYFEPAKWVAKLRTMKTDKNLLLFKCDMDAGHGGASGRFKALKEIALEYAFMLNLAGIGE